MKCALCGKEFEPSATACASCPMHSGCDLIRCPNCRYEFPKESKIVGFFSNLFDFIRNRKRRREKCPPKI